MFRMQKYGQYSRFPPVGHLAPPFFQNSETPTWLGLQNSHLPTTPRMITFHLHYQFSHDSHSPSPRWSPNIRRMITHHPHKGGYSPAAGQSSTIQRMVTNNPEDSHFYPQDSQLESTDRHGKRSNLSTDAFC